MTRFILLTVLILGVAGVSARAQSTENAYGLVGLRTVYLAVEDLDPGLQTAGLTATGLKTEMIEMVSAMGLTVASGEDPLESPKGEAVLRLSIQTNPISENNRIYTVRLDVRQRVTLERDPSATLTASTWYVGDHGMTPMKDVKEIRNTVRDLMGRLAADYQKANPKR